MPGKDIYENIRTSGGISLEYVDLIESNFSAANGAAYSPPERGDFRRINVSRSIQLLGECPVVVETFQTSAAEIRFPASTASTSTDDAGDGRMFIVKNAGTGLLTIKDYLGTTVWVLAAGLTVVVFGNSLNNWDIFPQLQTNSGVVAATTFTGTPRTAAVTFSTPFATATYAVTVTGSDGRSWIVTSRTVNGFTINSQANAALTGPVFWHAIAIGESI